MAQPRQAQANTLQQEILAYIDRNPVFWRVLIAIIVNFHSAWLRILLSKFVENLWLLMGVHFVVLLVLAVICFGNKFKDSQKTKKQRFLELVESKYDALEEHETDTFISEMEEHTTTFQPPETKPTGSQEKEEETLPE
ncbi:hypothetical protein DdX_12598 [Ditylenchus destructor]|uniref:Uncharacterized protein n=1 Tax=Ditylenchus destructor TaxID=166010 RepID=A0AAD4N0H9_9BILA|nr:hypothetical protein DdX_12598 [Ditylenchus destructor]